ncbi:MAG: DegT/DnrJ/EryC1/StrS family aminotransferase [Patescibacteria group bacterium]|nr:DegT/DnrJ/EryC1/StrS family aminotransferase [Patescibacteria group bacterium]
MRPIAISLAPNAERADVWRAFFLLLRPWRWRRGRARRERVRMLEEEFRRHFGTAHVWSFNSGRSALYVLLKALGVGEGSEVIVQAFTCNAVPNPILWLGATPVYADIEERTFNLDPAAAERKITERTKALIIQHTFGIPADVERIVGIARQRNLVVIEDCAHSLGAKANGQKLGTFGDAAFFSFGRDKVISSVYGGMLAVKDGALAQKIAAAYEHVALPPRRWVFQQLVHPVIFALALPFYRLGIGKLMIAVARRLHLLSVAVSRAERQGEKPAVFPARLPEALAALALAQFRRLEKFNEYRRGIAHYYETELMQLNERINNTPQHAQQETYRLPLVHEGATPVWLRYPVCCANAAELLTAARKKGIYLGDWYREVVAPQGTDLATMGYHKGACPVAERMAERVINLPTYPRLSFRQAEKVVRLLRSFLAA